MFTKVLFVAVVLLVAMEREADGGDESKADGNGEDHTHDTSESDGCGFSALFKHKHRNSSVDESEVQPVIEKDGIAAAAVPDRVDISSIPTGDQPSADSPATLQIPEYASFSVTSDFTNIILCPLIHTFIHHPSFFIVACF